ncbi:hypothetical protein RFI_34437, partial [Reticulomyxa filosa]
HCFVKKTKNESSNKKKTEMLLFWDNMGLSIEYDEQSNTFQFSKVPICTTMRKMTGYFYVQINDIILFFGRIGTVNDSKLAHRYSIKDNTWMQFEQSLHTSLTGCIGILSADAVFVHIIGEYYTTSNETIHLKTRVKEWMRKETEKERRWMEEEAEKRQAEDIYKDLQEMGDEIDLNKMKVINFFFFFFIKCVEIVWGEKKKIYKEIGTIIEHWVRCSLSVKIGWIDDFNKIILRFIMVMYFVVAMDITFLYTLHKYI